MTDQKSKPMPNTRPTQVLSGARVSLPVPAARSSTRLPGTSRSSVAQRADTLPLCFNPLSAEETPCNPPTTQRRRTTYEGRIARSLFTAKGEIR